MVAREGSAPSTSGCRPDAILFHHRAGLYRLSLLRTAISWLPGLELHQHSRLQRALSYDLDDPAFKWWPARVTRPVLRIKSPLHHFNACRPNWCSRQDLHLHWRRSRRRASALGYASCLRSATKEWSLQPGMLRQEFFTKEIRRLLHGGKMAKITESRPIPA